MLIGGALSILLVAGLGAQLSNYAWREAQWEELRAALRAAVSATAHLLPRITQAAVQEQVRQRVADFVQGQVEGLDMDPDDVTVAHDAGSRTTTITIGGNATYAMSDVWGGGGSEDAATLPAQSVSVVLDTERYEVAIAADVTSSMAQRFSVGATDPTTKLDGLKAAVEVVATLMDEVNAQNPGAMAVALVPFGSAVNVAETGGSGETEGKRRYAHMLTGAEPGSAGATATTGHWVDTFHHYGTGNDMGELYQRELPDFYRGGSDWNLRATGTDLDVSAQVPSLATWTVDGEDFWQGCVMARWGAYWHADARPDAWDADDPDAGAWPATGDVAAWTTASAGLTGEPLHLSDAPPAHGDPNTRFTAYSWPDARIGGSADGRLEALLFATLESTTPLSSATWRNRLPRLVGFNNWSLTSFSGNGATLCPEDPILPLSDVGATLRAASTALRFVPPYHGIGMTYLHLGPVWGLRVLSPLWRSVWNTSDAAGVARPLAACAAGETGAHCDSLLRKSILLITDGASAIGGALVPGRVAETTQADRPASLRPNTRGKGVCTLLAGASTGDYRDHRDESDPATFNDLFRTEADDRFGAHAGPVLDGIEALFDQADNRADRSAWSRVVGDLTPWQLFRGDGRTNGADNVNDLLADSQNRFGLDGRVVHRNVCRMSDPFGPYGQIDDLVQVGGAPVEGVAPFARGPGWPTTPGGLRTRLTARLDGWFLDACRIADARGVTIRAIYIGSNPGASDQSLLAQADRANITRLEQCVDAAGGASGVQDVFVTPDEAALEEAFREVFTVDRNLRFLD